MLNAQVDKLITVEAYVSTCICGAPKERTSFIKADAAQFFKDADPARGLDRAAALLRRVTQRTRKNAIAVFNTQAAKGFLCDGQRRRSGMYRIAPFTTILKAVEMAAQDKLMSLGNCIVKRVRGWPMGGSLSEPATLADLGHDVHYLYTSTSVAQRCGFYLEGYATQELVQGLGASAQRTHDHVRRSS